MKEIKTVAAYGMDEHVEKKSRFIGQAWPVETEEEVKEILARTRKEYWDASHNVYAYILSPKDIGRSNGAPLQKFSDDGEPGGTAGKPCLDVIAGQGLVDVLVIVTRYFGGTLLGTGGLVRAYTKGAQIALAAAGIIEKKVYLEGSVRMDYGSLSKIQYLVGKRPVEEVSIKDTVYAEDVCMQLLVREDVSKSFEEEIIKASDGRLSLEKANRVLAAKVRNEIKVFP